MRSPLAENNWTNQIFMARTRRGQYSSVDWWHRPKIQYFSSSRMTLDRYNLVPVSGITHAWRRVHNYYPAACTRMGGTKRAFRFGSIGVLNVGPRRRTRHQIESVMNVKDQWDRFGSEGLSFVDLLRFHRALLENTLTRNKRRKKKEKRGANHRFLGSFFTPDIRSRSSFPRQERNKSVRASSC